MEDANWLAGLHQQRLVALQTSQRAHDGVETFPVARRLARAAVNHQIVRSLGHLRVEIVHQHAQGSFLWPALAAQRTPTRGANRVRTRWHSFGHIWRRHSAY